jgi:lipid-A-disaccharide synthase
VSLRIGIVVGETSGDNLAVNLIRSLRHYDADLTFEGILGPELIQYFIKDPPDLFIGVDVPDFNLRLEQQLKQHGIRTVHYVSPTVWAWRKNRIHLIKKAVDLMITLFPFEAKCYKEHQIPVCFAGHPAADLIPLEINQKKAKEDLIFKEQQTVIAILPGSRNNELKYLSRIFLNTARLCFEKRPDLQFVVPLVSKEHQKYFLALKSIVAPNVPIKVLLGNAYTAMAAAEAVLVASGTATLEVMLHKKPMVVAYRMHPLTYQIARLLVKIPYIALPNLLAEEGLVPEYIQDKAKPEALSQALFKYLSSSSAVERQRLVKKFNELHLILKQDASKKAARAIATLLNLPV